MRKVATMFVMAFLLTSGLVLMPDSAQAQADSIQVEQDDSASQSDSEWKYVPVRRYSVAMVESPSVEDVAVESSDVSFDGQLLTAEDLATEQQH